MLSLIYLFSHLHLSKDHYLGWRVPSFLVLCLPLPPSSYRGTANFSLFISTTDQPLFYDWMICHTILSLVLFRYYSTHLIEVPPLLTFVKPLLSLLAAEVPPPLSVFLSLPCLAIHTSLTSETRSKDWRNYLLHTSILIAIIWSRKATVYFDHHVLASPSTTH